MPRINSNIPPKQRELPPPELLPYSVLRREQVLRLFPVSPSEWHQGIRDGRFPPGRLLSRRVRVWSGREILSLIEGNYCPTTAKENKEAASHDEI